MSLTRTPLSMLDAKGTSKSDVVYDGKEVVVENDSNNVSGDPVSGFFDDVTGTLVLNLENGTQIKISGLPTVNSLGQGAVGPTGPRGENGTNGANGTNGEKGSTGCQGPPGTPGKQGAVGPTGAAGEIGPRGETGPTGPRGDDGIVQVFIQTADPTTTSGSLVAAGAIWVKP